MRASYLVCCFGAKIRGADAAQDFRETEGCVCFFRVPHLDSEPEYPKRVFVVQAGCSGSRAFAGDAG